MRGADKTCTDPMSILYTKRRRRAPLDVAKCAPLPHSLIYPSGRNQCNYAENKGVNSQAARAQVIFNLLAQTATGAYITVGNF